MCDLELAISTSSLGVDDTLWDTLTIEMCKLINQVEVLEKQRTIWATGSLVGLWVLDRSSIGGGVDWLLVVLEGRGGLLVSTHDCG